MNSYTYQILQIGPEVYLRTADDLTINVDITTNLNGIDYFCVTYVL